MDDLLYKVALEMIPMVGSITAKKLLAYCGNAEAVFRETKVNLLKIPNIGEGIANSILNKNVLKKAENELVFMQKNNIEALFYADDNYPHCLFQCEDSPIILFKKGDVDLNAYRTISIVGTRNCTSYGTEFCEKLIATIAEQEYNTVIVSGLAYGIDVCAHKAALKYGIPTVAVVGTGLDMVYPAAHKSIANQIIEQKGAMLSDFPTQTVIDPKNFIRRNRIIAGLSEVTIVVESAEKGGAMVTADIAASYNRDVLAFPGRVGDKFSAGCNKLIKNNIAAMIESIDDLVAAMGWDSPSERLTTKQLPLFDMLNPEEMSIVNVLKENEIEIIDVIARKTGLPMAKLSALLLNLEFSGYVKALPGKAYILKRN